MSQKFMRWNFGSLSASTSAFTLPGSFVDEVSWTDETTVCPRNYHETTPCFNMVWKRYDGSRWIEAATEAVDVDRGTSLTQGVCPARFPAPQQRPFHLDR